MESKDGATSRPRPSETAPFFVSQRFLLAVLGFIGFYVVYSLRINMSFALVCMVNNTAVSLLSADNESTDVVTNQCQDLDGQNSGNSSTNKEHGEFVWSSEEQGLMLSSFFWGYIVTQVPGGWLAGRFGGKHVYGVSMLVCIICTLVTPVFAHVSYWAVIVLRIIQGMTQGVVFPAIYCLWAHWAPPYERSRLVSYSTTGVNLGTVLPLSISGLLCANLGWESVFYVFGIIGFIWFVAWTFLVRDTPSSHPRITEREKSYIHESLQGQMTDEDGKLSVPWKSIFTSLPVWATICTHASFNWANYTLLTMLPRFMKNVLGFDIKSNGLYSALPYLASWATMFLCAPFADYLIRRQILSNTNVRRIFNSIGCMLPGLLLLWAGRVGCETRWLGVLLLVVGQAFAGFRVAGYMCSHIDMAPRYAGILFGISNVGGTVSGIVAPYVAGLILTTQSEEEWRLVFDISCAVMCAGALFYLIFIDVSVQPWAKTDDDLTNQDIKNDTAAKQHEPRDNKDFTVNAAEDDKGNIAATTKC